MDSERLWQQRTERKKKESKKRKKMTENKKKCVEITQLITNITCQHKKPSKIKDVTET